MSGQPADHKVRERVLDPAGSFIVQAPAGSGKTSLLTQRILRLLSVVNKPEEILAITFTRKATAEMHERLLSVLRRAASEQVPEQAHEQTTYHLARAVLARDTELGWELLAYPDRIRITTIDGFCAALVRQMPWLSQAGGLTNTTEHPDQLYIAAARECLMNLAHTDGTAAKHLATVLRAQDNNARRVSDLLVAMLARRDQWLRHIVHAEFNRDRTHIAQAWRSVIDDELRRARAGIDEEFIKAVLIVAQDAAARLAADQPESAMVALAGLETLPDSGNEAVRAWKGLAELLLTAAGKPRKQVNIRQGFEPGSEAKAAMTDLLESFAADETAQTILRSASTLPDADFSEAQWQQLAALSEVLKLAAAELRLQFAAAGKVDFTEVSQRALLALEDLGAPTELALKLDYSITHILVDEFQDTSQSQFALLEKLIEGWQADGQKTLFFVGDPMQSIYRFREADVGLFLRVTGQGIGAMRPEFCQLSANFRSDPVLIDWFNQVFGHSMPQEDHAALGAVHYSPATAGQAPQTGAAVELIACQDALAEAEQVAVAVQACIQRGDKSIAVLVRQRSQLEYILPVLRANGVRYHGIDLDLLKDQPAIMDLRLISRCLVRADDRIAWLGLLRSPLVGLNLSELKTLVGTDYRRDIWACANAAAGVATLPESAQVRLQKLVEVMTIARSLHRRLALQPVVEYTWEALGGRMALGALGESDIEVFWRLLDELDNGQTFPLDELDLRMQNLFAAGHVKVDDRNGYSLEISTMHKAKGLQYDSVILPGLGRRPASDDRAFLMWSEQQSEQSGDSALLLAPLTDSADDPHYEYLRQQERQRAVYEQQRLMYVACTRAKRHLYLLSGFDVRDEEIKPPPRGSLLHHLWGILEDEFRVLPVIESDQAPDGTPQTVLYRLPDGLDTKPLQALPWHRAQAEPRGSEAVEYDWAGDTARLVGQWLHHWLQQIDHPDQLTNAPTQDQLRAELSLSGITGDELEPAVERTLKAILVMQADDRLRWLLSDYPHAHNEYDLSYLGEHGVERIRIDRTFEEADVRWIVDYKTGRHLEKDLDEWLDQEQTRHRAQLERYAAVMHQKEPRETRLGLYFPMHGAWREWRYQPAEQ